MTLLDTAHIDEVLEPDITAHVAYMARPGNGWYIVLTYHPSGTEVHQNHDKATFYEFKKHAELVAEIITKGFDTLD